MCISIFNAPPKMGGWDQLAKLARHSAISLFGSSAADLYLLSTFTTGRPRAPALDFYEHRGALRGTPGSAYPQPEPNATELPKWRPRPPKVGRAARLRAFAHADTRRGTHRHDAGLQTSRPSAFAHSDTRRTPRRAADRAPPRPRPPPHAEENCTLHLLIWERNTSRETLGVLPTWAPATAMKLPLRIVRHLLVYSHLWYRRCALPF